MQSKSLSCHGGNSLRAYEYIHSTLKFIPDDSCLGYLACSSESDEGMCPQIRRLTTCDDWNVCRTCDGFKTSNNENPLLFNGEKENGSHGDEEEAMDEYGCRAVPKGFPNVTILEYGGIEPENIHAIMSEIYSRYVWVVGRGTHPPAFFPQTKLSPSFVFYCARPYCIHPGGQSKLQLTLFQLKTIWGEFLARTMIRHYLTQLITMALAS